MLTKMFFYIKHMLIFSKSAFPSIAFLPSRTYPEVGTQKFQNPSENGVSRLLEVSVN
jgi:hypothetical protein